MKKSLSVMTYILLSVLLFFSGVMLEASPSEILDLAIQDLRDKGDQDLRDKGDQDLKDKSIPDLEKQIIERYYYSLLDDSQKQAYTKIQEAEAAEQESVLLEAMDPQELNRVFMSVHGDYPEYFWCERSYSYRSDTDGMELIFEYNCVGAEKEKKENAIEKQASEILAGIADYDEDYDKIKYVFETLVDMTEYDMNAPDNQNIYSVFGNWRSVCDGYAKATKYLLDRAGVECIYVTGYARGEAHAWNIVRCNDKYYYVDTTWGDPLYQEQQGENVPENATQYAYLCAAEQMMMRTHTPNKDFVLPECTDHSMEYYRLQGKYLETADQEAILNIMKKDVDDNQKKTEIQFLDDDVLNQVVSQLDPILQQVREYAGAQKGKTLDTISYQYWDAASVLIVYWE